ncbi:MAG: hypothetical protein RJA78_821 [Actinomycetota bacterium]
MGSSRLLSSVKLLALGLLVAALMPIVVIQAQASETYQVVVHVPLAKGSAPENPTVSLTDTLNTGNTSISRAFGRDSYGWFGVANMPVAAESIRLNATNLPYSPISINPAKTREIWLNSKGVPFSTEIAASGKLLVTLFPKATAMKNRQLRVAIGKSVKLYSFIKSGDKLIANVPVSASTQTVKLVVMNKAKAGRTYYVSPPKSAKVWVSDVFTGVRTSESWARDQLTIHYKRSDGMYSGWGIHSWSTVDGGTTQNVLWDSPITPTSTNPDAWGITFTVPLKANSKTVPIIIHKGNEKDPTTLDQFVNLAETKGEIWYESGSANADSSLRYTIPVSLEDETTPVPPTPVVAPTLAQAQSLASSSLRSAMAEDNIYFVMTDRYKNGTALNDRMGITGTRDVTGFDSASNAYYHGGDFAGLTDGCTTGNGVQRLKDMGFSAIWITPPFKQRYVQGSSASYHGYWITDFTDIDPHLGTKAEFKDFVDCVHSQDMKVVLDIVMNHTGDVNYYPSGNYSFGAPRPAQVSAGDMNIRKPTFLNELTNYHNRGDVQDWNNKEQSQNGDFFGLDDIATEKSEVVEGFAQAYAYWVNEFGVDGFRIDTAKHVDDEFLGKWWPRVKELTSVKKPNLFAFGEVYDGRTSVLTQFVRDRGIPATLDFAFQSAAVQFASGNNISDITSVFAADDWYITEHSNAYNQPTFLGNHDMGRFGQMLKWAGSPSGDLWGDALLGYDLMYLARGIPNVYYGDEVGIIGSGGDKEARQDLFPTNVTSWRSQERIAANPIGSASYLDENNHPIQERITALNSLRNQHPALKIGAQIQRYSGNNVIAFSRFDSESRTEYLVALNNAQSSRTNLIVKTSSPNTVFTEVWGQAQTVTSDSQGFISISVGPREAVVLKALSALPVKNSVAPVILSVSKEPGAAIWKPQATIADWDDPSTCTFVVSVNGGAWQVLGVDDSYDWKMILTGSRFSSGAKINIAAVVVSSSGAMGISNAVQITNVP